MPTIEELQAEILELKKKINEISNENFELKSKQLDLENQVTNLTNENKSLTEKNLQNEKKVLELTQVDDAKDADNEVVDENNEKYSETFNEFYVE